MTAYLVVLVVGLGSYAFRMSILVLAARAGVPPVVERAAQHAVPVSFAALAATALADHVAAAEVALAPVAAVIAAVVAVHRTGRPYAAIAAGMPTLWLLTALTSA